MLSKGAPNNLKLQAIDLKKAFASIVGAANLQENEGAYKIDDVLKLIENL